MFGTAARRVVSVSLMSGRERWAWPVGGDVSGLPAADDKRIYFAARDNVLRAVDRQSGNLRWSAARPSRPSGSPLPLPNTLLMPLVGSAIAGFDLVTGKPTVTVQSAGEIGLQPFFRHDARTTAVRLVTVSREGQLQGFAQRFEPVPVPLAEYKDRRLDLEFIAQVERDGDGQTLLLRFDGARRLDCGTLFTSDGSRARRMACAAVALAQGIYQGRWHRRALARRQRR